MRWLALALFAFAVADIIATVPLKLFVYVISGATLAGYLVLTWIAYQLQAAERGESDEG